MICNNEQLAIMVKDRPQSLNELLKIEGIGKVKAEKYGSDILNILKPVKEKGEEHQNGIQ